MKLVAALVALLGSLAGPAAAQPAPPTAAELLAGVQVFYANVDGYDAKFRQEVTTVMSKRTAITDGTLRFDRAAALRVWYYPKPRGAHRIPARSLANSPLPTAIAFLARNANLITDFTPRLDASGTYGGKSDRVLELTPTAATSPFRTLHFVVVDQRVREAIVTDHVGNRFHVHFYEPKLHTP